MSLALTKTKEEVPVVASESVYMPRVALFHAQLSHSGYRIRAQLWKFSVKALAQLWNFCLTPRLRPMQWVCSSWNISI